MAGSIGMAWAGNGRSVAGVSCLNAAGALQGPWTRGKTWGGRPAARPGAGRAFQRPVAAAVSAPSAARVRRPRAGTQIRWRRLAAMAGDVIMVAVWAAMIPGLMWLGAAAGF